MSGHHSEENIIMSEEKIANPKEKLPFAKNEVYRLMKDNLDNDKMIKEQVKVEMNRFLYSILKNVCQKLNEYPYTTVDYSMFNFIVQEFSGFFKPGMNCTFSGLVSIFFFYVDGVVRLLIKCSRINAIL